MLNKEIALSEAGMMFNPRTGESFMVNQMGVEIIYQLKEGKSIGEITQHIMNEYDSESGMIERDILDFISLLKQFQLTIQETHE